MPISHTKSSQVLGSCQLKALITQPGRRLEGFEKEQKDAQQVVPLDNVKTMEYLGIIMVRPWRVQYKGEIFDVGLSAVTKAAVCINEQMKTQKRTQKENRHDFPRSHSTLNSLNGLNSLVKRTTLLYFLPRSNNFIPWFHLF